MITLDDSIRSRIREHGLRAYPNEACGVLLGRLPGDATSATRAVTRDLPLENSREAGEQYHRFVITPQDYLRAEKRADELGLDIVGFYHSHPDHPAVPSEYDRDHAFPGLSYIVTSVVGKGLESPHIERNLSWTLALDRSEFLFEADLDEDRQPAAGSNPPGPTASSSTPLSTTSSNKE